MSAVDQTNPGSSISDRIASIPVRVTSDVDLLDRDGNDVLFWIVDGAIHVHPSNLSLMRQAVVGHRIAFPMPKVYR